MEKEIPSQQPRVNIRYRRADRTKRVFARLIDLFLLVSLGIVFFFSCRSIVQMTPGYKERENRVHLHRVESGVYTTVNGKDRDLVSYYKDNADITAFYKRRAYESGLSQFLSYCKENLSEKDSSDIQASYQDYLLKQENKEEKRFVLSSGKREKNSSCGAKWADYNACYESFLDYQARSYLYNYFPSYQKDIRRQSLYRVALELPLSVVLSSFLVYRLPCLIRKRGRKTIGRLVYHISLADSRLLHVKTGRFLGYAFIRMFAIVALSFLTLGIPLLIDISRLAFTKNRQDFGEYRLGINEIDDSIEKIYYSLAEAEQDHSSNQRISKQFVAPDRLDE